MSTSKRWKVEAEHPRRFGNMIDVVEAPDADAAVAEYRARQHGYVVGRLGPVTDEWPIVNVEPLD